MHADKAAPSAVEFPSALEFRADAQALLALDAALEEKERQLPAAGEPGSVAALRWAALLEERRLACARWRVLGADKVALLQRHLVCRRGPAVMRMERDATHGRDDAGAVVADALSSARAEERAFFALPIEVSFAATAPLCAVWSVQQFSLYEHQQADMPCLSCCFQR